MFMTRYLRPLAIVLSTLASVPAHAEWHEAKSDHFRIYADAPEAWVRRYADRLERFDATMRIVRNVPSQPSDLANPVTVYVVPDVDAIQALYSRKANMVAGFYVPRMASVAYVPRESRGRAGSGDATLFHEYAHHIMFRATRIGLPKWYAEGFAEVFSAALIADDGRVDVGRQAGHRAPTLLNAQSLPIEKLLSGDDNGNGDLFYGRAWLLTHMLTFDKSRAGQVTKYLTLLSGGTPNLEAAQQAFGDLRALDRAMDSYMARPLTYTSFNADRVKPGPIVVRALSAGEAAMMPIRLRSDRGVKKAEAPAIVADARQLAGPFATDPGAQTALAEAEFDAGNDAQADAAADRALAIDASNIDALLYKGHVAQRRAVDAKATDAATWKVVRSWYSKAATARPDAAEPLAAFYSTYGKQGIAPTANASAALLKAFENAPQDPNLRFAAAREMLRLGQVSQARQALIPLAFNPHAQAKTNFALQLVKMIDAGEPAEKVAAAVPAKPDDDDDTD